jgi:hypothetical protein
MFQSSTKLSLANHGSEDFDMEAIASLVKGDELRISEIGLEIWIGISEIGLGRGIGISEIGLEIGIGISEIGLEIGIGISEIGRGIGIGLGLGGEPLWNGITSS